VGRRSITDEGMAMSGDASMTRLAGLPFPHVDLATATELLLSPAGLRTARPWRLINTFNISLLRGHPHYAAILDRDGVNLADGKPVAWVLRVLSRRTGQPSSPEQVRGAALFSSALDQGRALGVRHYLLGGSPETLRALQEAIAVRYPGALIAGAASPPFRPMTEAEMAAQDKAIRASGADLVWVGLGTPKQDHECVRLAESVGRPAIAVGAAFEFLAGTRPEAPVWVQRMALEWLFRLVGEPRRLWRRYTLGIAQFLLVVSGDLLPGRGIPAREPVTSSSLRATSAAPKGDQLADGRRSALP
jgi:N-acetylglucosaminyldiphosphoundecaprenol N-acetyl-beta-D-mannosaminyltransferase